MAIFVVKIGGSLISKDPVSLIDSEFVKSLRDVIINNNMNTGNKFALICGGGAIMRRYRDVLVEAGVDNDQDIHWIGTTVNIINAMVLKCFFGEKADEEIFKYEDYYDDTKFNIEKIVRLGGGGRPGHSGDVDTVISAKKLGSKTIYSLKNVDGVYEADPKIKPDAKRLAKLSWDEYLNIIGNPTEHKPGANFPIDPIASKMAKEAGIKFIIMNGDMENFKNAIEGKEYIGTIVE
jgi:uridylate kinase